MLNLLQPNQCRFEDFYSMHTSVMSAPEMQALIFHWLENKPAPEQAVVRGLICAIFVQRDQTCRIV